MNSLPSNSPDRNYITTIAIYSLLDPETEQIYYIGKSVRPKDRFLAHVHDHAPSPKTVWIQGLARRGLRPQLHIIEEVPRDQGEAREIYWITYYLEQGHPLTNVRDNRLQKRKRYAPSETDSPFARQLQLARKTYYSSKQSDLNIAIIKKRYEFSTDSDAIRFALYMLASADFHVVLQAKKKIPTKRKGKFLDNQQELF